MKKTFMLDLQDSLTYPSAETICAAVETYAREGKEELTFVSREKPVTFLLSGAVWRVDIGMIRGGYTLYCRQV